MGGGECGLAEEEADEPACVLNMCLSTCTLELKEEGRLFGCNTKRLS